MTDPHRMAAGTGDDVERRLRPRLEEAARKHGFVLLDVVRFDFHGQISARWGFEELKRQWACRVALPDESDETLKRVAAELTSKATAWLNAHQHKGKAE